MDIQIRAVEVQDAGDIAAIYSHETVIEQTTQLPHGNAAFWQNFYANAGGDALEFVAVCDGRAVGHMGILLNRNPRRKHVASFGIAIHPDYHRKGVGQAMMEELVRLADNWLNLRRIELSVFTDNEAAIALYRKFGFEIEGESRFDVFRQGRYASSYRMARLHPQLSGKARP